VDFLDNSPICDHGKPFASFAKQSEFWSETYYAKQNNAESEQLSPKGLSCERSYVKQSNAKQRPQFQANKWISWTKVKIIPMI
jgi:hypothetical protein